MVSIGFVCVSVYVFILLRVRLAANGGAPD